MYNSEPFTAIECSEVFLGDQPCKYVLAATIIRALITLIMAASTSETSVNFYQATRRNNQEDSRLHTCRRENLKSHHYLFGYLLNTRQTLSEQGTGRGQFWALNKATIVNQCPLVHIIIIVVLEIQGVPFKTQPNNSLVLRYKNEVRSGSNLA
jgi:hypothetical protein